MPITRDFPSFWKDLAVLKLKTFAYSINFVGPAGGGQGFSGNRAERHRRRFAAAAGVGARGQPYRAGACRPGRLSFHEQALMRCANMSLTAAEEATLHSESRGSLFDLEHLVVHSFGMHSFRVAINLP